MATLPRAVVSWSSGKDSALLLFRNLQSPEYEIVSLITTVTEGAGRVTMHGVREDLVEKQAERMGLPLQKVPLPFPSTNAVYEQRLGEALLGWKAKGVTHVLFGDLFLEDIRRYREEHVRKLGLVPVFPLWGESTKALAQEMIGAGLEAILTCVDSKKLPKDFAGRSYDKRLLKGLPESVDPCGENGEFHTFVTNAPFFKSRIEVKVGETVSKQGFEFADLEEPAN